MPVKGCVRRGTRPDRAREEQLCSKRPKLCNLVPAHSGRRENCGQVRATIPDLSCRAPCAERSRLWVERTHGGPRDGTRTTEQKVLRRRRGRRREEREKRYHLLPRALHYRNIRDYICLIESCWVLQTKAARLSIPHASILWAGHCRKPQHCRPPGITCTEAFANRLANLVERWANVRDSADDVKGRDKARGLEAGARTAVDGVWLLIWLMRGVCRRTAVVDARQDASRKRSSHRAFLYRSRVPPSL